MNDNVQSQINARLSLREPQRESMRRLVDVLDKIAIAKDIDQERALAIVREAYSDVTSFERNFPSLCFALATGVGKTRLMGAFITYLYVTGRSKNFFVLAPNLTIYEKLIKDFSEGSPKYVFKGIAEFARNAPQIVTGDTYQDGRGLRRSGDLFAADCIINIFNISKINSEARGGNKPRMMRLKEVLGESYFDYLSRLPDLVLLMDEAHRYRATAGVNAINALQPILGLELTATPKGFNNVIYRYGLGDAMADGFVKEPAVATQANFNAAQHDAESLERLKLEDGVVCHEFTKTRLDLYARRTGRDPVHPFMLVVAESIEHAKELRTRVEANNFFNGHYKGKVIEVHSGQGAADREKVERQLVALETDKSTEIVIHVNQLNEGWDVKNLYTIVPLRAFAASILTEQTLGRGLRLPYGERTGDEAVDRLTIIAHDHFDEIIKRAKEPGAITMREIRIGAGGDIPAKGEEIITAKPSYQAKIEKQLADTGGFGEQEQQALDVTRRVIEEEARRMTSGFKQLETQDARAAVAARVQAIMQPTQGSLDIGPTVDVSRVVDAYITNLVKHSIEIPEIVVLPSRKDVTFGFNDFDLAGLDRIGVRPVDGEVIVEDLRTGRRETIEVKTVGAKEQKLENYLVRRLIENDAVDYDQNAQLLFKLAGQMISHLGTYLNEAEIEAVLLRDQGSMLAEFIYEQMMEDGHYWETQTTYEPIVTRGFVTVGDHHFGKDRNLPLRDFREPAASRADTRKYLFNGFSKCGWDTQRFQSDDERRFAVLADLRSPEVKVWIKPGSGVFQISYQRGAKYEPDFLIETQTEMLICEIKAANELQDPIVRAKATASRTWVDAANTVAEGTGRKPWRYVLIPHSAITESSTLSGLANTYAQK